MASAFATGFMAGQRGYQQVLDNDRQKVLDERAAKEFARKEQEWSRADTERASVDRAISDYQDMVSSGRAVAQNSSGFSDGSARMLYGQGGQQAVDDAASYANVESARMGLPLTNRTSLPADPTAAPTPTVAMRQATPLDRIRGLEGIALAKKDVASMERLGGQRQLAEEDAFIADAMKSYKGTEDQIGGTASYINANSKRVTMGAPGKNGFVPLSVVGTDGRAEFLNLSKQDQAKLYAAGQLLERNPTRALEIMASVNKELASAIAQENGLVGKLATNANDVAYKGGQLAVAQQNADTNEAYRRQLGTAAGARASGARGTAGSSGKPVKMDVQTLDPVTGKSTKVQVIMDPATGNARTADGKPFTDSEALDRAMGRMSAESRIAAAEANDLQLLESQVKSGLIPFDQLDAARAKVRASYEPQRARLAFSGLDEQEKIAAVRDAVGAGGKPEAVAAALGVTPEYVKNAVGSQPRKSSMAPSMAAPQTTGLKLRKGELQQAYDDWQAAKPGWFRQETPTSRQKEAAAEARYTELLRNQYSK